MTYRSCGYTAPTCQLSDRDLDRISDELAAGVRAVTTDVPDLAQGLIWSQGYGFRGHTNPLAHPWRKKLPKGP